MKVIGLLLCSVFFTNIEHNRVRAVSVSWMEFEHICEIICFHFSRVKWLTIDLTFLLNWFIVWILVFKSDWMKHFGLKLMQHCVSLISSIVHWIKQHQSSYDSEFIRDSLNSCSILHFWILSVLIITWKLLSRILEIRLPLILNIGYILCVHRMMIIEMRNSSNTRIIKWYIRAKILSLLNK
jgi:hypothetical protein